MRKQKTAQKSSLRSESGLTLVELLIVTAIIALLASLILSAVTNAQKGARDSRRISDLKQYQTAIEQYGASNGGTYPANAWPLTSSGIAALVPNYMPTVVLGPTGGPNTNYYYAHGDPGDGQGYRWLMCAFQERKNQYAIVSKTGLRYGAACDWTNAPN